MKIELRPHHFLCLQGYKGQNYNKEQVKSWNNISDLLKSDPNIDVFIKSGKDDLCQNCAITAKSTDSNCFENSVKALDKKVEKLLNIESGKTYKYWDVVQKANEKITPKKHEELCEKCFWWLKGLCRTSFKK